MDDSTGFIQLDNSTGYDIASYFATHFNPSCDVIVTEFNVFDHKIWITSQVSICDVIHKYIQVKLSHEFTLSPNQIFIAEIWDTQHGS